MSIRNYLRQFLRDVRGQKLRTCLTLFGIVWGTAAVTLMLAFGEAMQGALIKSVKGMGENIVICWPSRTSRPWQGLPRGRAVRVTEEELERIRRDSPLVARLSAEYSAGPRVRVGRKVIVPGFSAVNAEFGEMRNLIPEANGRYLNGQDMARRRRVVFLGDKLKKDLFGVDDAVGHEVMINNVPFKVIGVMEHKNQDSNYNGPDDDLATIPSSTFRTMYTRRYVDNFVLQVKDRADSVPARKKVLAALARTHSFDPEDTEAISMWDTTEMLDFMDTFMGGFRIFLGIVGALTLLVGGIGVSNIMHVVVEERTKEIGVKMALGAKQSWVTGQFMFETLTLTGFGGLLGFAIAGGLCAVFPASLAEFIGTPRVSLQVAAITTCLLGLIAFFAGYFPARSAAAVNPIEALRL